MNSDNYDLVIIGAGICGLVLANEIKFEKPNLKFQVLEKSAGLGGRAASRRLNEQVVDHGTQYFTAQDQEFKALIEAWLEKGLVKLWTNKLSVWYGDRIAPEKGQKTRYICPQGMTSIAKDLAKGLPVKTNTLIVEAKRHSDKWHLKTEAGEEIHTKTIVSTAPLPQSLDLFADYLSAETKARLERITYTSCLSAILTFSPEIAAETLNKFKGIFWHSGNIISWVANDSSKRVNQPITQAILVIHCQPGFSEKNFEEDENVILDKIISELALGLGDWVKNPIEKQLKKWKYSQATNVAGKPYIASNDNSLILTGDWCIESKIEGAYLAALGVASLDFSLTSV